MLHMPAHPAEAEPARDTTSAQAQIAFFDAVERGRLREVEAFPLPGAV